MDTPVRRPASGRGIRWGLLAFTPRELSAELQLARDAYERGKLEEALAHTSRVLRALDRYRPAPGSGTDGDELEEVRASALVLRGLAESSQRGVPADRSSTLEEGTSTLRRLIGRGRVLDPYALADYGLGLLSTRRPDEAAQVLTRALTAAVPVPVGAVVRVGRELVRSGQPELARQVLDAGRLRYPKEAAVAEELAFACDELDVSTRTEAHLVAATLYAEVGDLPSAYRHLDIIQELEPSAARPRLMRAQLQLADGVPADEVQHALAALVVDHPALPEARALLGAAQVAAGDHAAAAETLHAALEDFGEDPSILDALTRLHLAAGRHDEALATLDRVAAVEPDEPEWWLLRSDVLRAQQRTPEAVKALRRAVELVPDDADVRLELARLLVSDGRLEEGLDALAQARAAIAGDPRLAAETAEVLLRLGRPAEVVSAAQEALRQDPTLTSASAALADAYLALDQLPDARAAAQQALDRDADLVRARRVRGLVAARTGDVETAIDDLEAVVTAAPDDRSARPALVKALVDAGSGFLFSGDGTALERAQHALERALDVDPDDPAAHATLGELLRRREDFPAALEHLRIAERARPDSAWIVGTRGQVLRALGDDEAVEVLREAARLDPSLAWVRAELGDELRLLGRYTEALDELEAAVQLDPENEWAWASKGAAEYAAERYLEALGSLDEALRINPGYAWALAVLGVTLLDVDELEGARTALEQIADTYDVSWVWLALGTARLYIDGPDEETVAAFRRAVDADTEDVWAVTALGEALSVRQGADDVAEANALFETVIVRVDEHGTTGEVPGWMFAAAGWAALRVGRYEAAVRALRRALRADSSLTGVEFDLGLALLRWGRREVGLEQYDKACQIVGAIALPGRRASLVRAARRDVDAVMSAPELAQDRRAAHRRLESIESIDSVPLEPDDDEEGRTMQLIPATYKCRAHDRELTTEVARALDEEGIPVNGYAFRRSRGGTTMEGSFRVTVSCPGPDPHELLFRGTRVR